jgi:hypothetical protein
VRRFLTLVGLLLASHGTAWPQGVEEMQRIIRERDAEIEGLKRRIEKLEQDASRPSDADDDDMNRALERALIQQGGMLLPLGAYELEPQASYAHWDKSRSTLRHETDMALSLRAGLPWDSQIQVRIPYVHVSTSAGSETALGDVDLSLSRQFKREGGSLPSLVGSLGWHGRTGKDALNGGVPTGGGFDAVQVGVTALKRHDPLVYYGGLSYSSPLSRNIGGTDVDPGDALGVRLGGILAARPDTSVNLGLNLAFVRATRLDGQRVPESDTVLGTLQVGFGTIVTRRVMLNLSADLRVTGEVPNFRLNAAIPIRF